MISLAARSGLRDPAARTEGSIGRQRSPAYSHRPMRQIASQPVRELKTVFEPARRRRRQAPADGRHRRRHLAVRLPAAAGPHAGDRSPATPAEGLVPLDRRHTPLPFVHRGRTPARPGRALRPGVGSGWEERAEEHLPHLLGLPAGLPFLRFARSPRDAANAHWKLDAIDAYAGTRPLAWIDDAFNEACHEWAARARGADAARADRARARAHGARGAAARGVGVALRGLNARRR